MLKISYVSQKAQAFKSGFPKSVKEVVLSGLTKRKNYFALTKKMKKGCNCITRLNISNLIDKNIL